MSDNFKKLLVYITLAIFFTLLPYWAFGQNLTQLQNEETNLRSENSALYDEITERSNFIKNYSNLEEDLELFYAAETSPDKVIEFLVGLAIENGLVINNIMQTSETFPDTSLVKFTTEAVFSSETKISELVLTSLKNKENVNSVKSLESSLNPDGLHVTRIIVETLTN
jgi:hypothetical protein